MKIISAGFPKTGTKSASRALRLVTFTWFIELFMRRGVTAVVFESRIISFLSESWAIMSVMYSNPLNMES